MTGGVEHWEALYRESKVLLPWEDLSLPSDIRRWASLVPPPATVLDAGCGRGRHVLHLANLGYTVTGLDFSPSAIAHARGLANSAAVANRPSFQITDIRRYRPVGTCQLVYSYSILHHVADDDLSEVIGVLCQLVAPQGLLGIVCYAQLFGQLSPSVQRTGALGNTIYHRTAEAILRTVPRGFGLLSYSASALGPHRSHPAHSFTFENSCPLPGLDGTDMAPPFAADVA
jgi:2-polyprenyl-3-methyl-5-hydroxy-6-metoxy-1,4-benzoquinol methylase